MNIDYVSEFKKAIQKTARYWNEFLESDEVRVYSEGVLQTAQLYAEALAHNDLQELVELEMLALSQEYAYHEKNSPEIKADFEPLLNSFEEGVLEELKIINSPEDYKIALLTHRISKKPKSVPKDAFHAAINNHIKFLENRIAEPSTLPAERAFFHARLNNMKAAKELYIGKQREIIELSLALPHNSKQAAK